MPLIMFIILIMEISTKKGTATAVPKIALFAREEAAAVLAATDENIFDELNAVININSFLNMQ